MNFDDFRYVQKNTKEYIYVHVQNLALLMLPQDTGVPLTPL